tara:strand:+ start:1023 stop:1367 length:345 start_codon:yes stop_codon:yes gene_type:complete
LAYQPKKCFVTTPNLRELKLAPLRELRVLSKKERNYLPINSVTVLFVLKARNSAKISPRIPCLGSTMAGRYMLFNITQYIIRQTEHSGVHKIPLEINMNRIKAVKLVPVPSGYT